jgi:hypothetical protein
MTQGILPRLDRKKFLKPKAGTSIVSIDVKLPDGKPRDIPKPRSRTHEWTDRVATQKKITRWEKYIENREKQIAYAKEQIEKLTAILWK